MKLFVTNSNGSILLVRANDGQEAANLTHMRLNLKEGKEVHLTEVSEVGEAEVLYKFVPRE